MNNEYEIALRQKLRFASNQGLLSVEDLWDLPLTSTTNRANLDDVAKKLHHEIRNSAETVSFVTDTVTANPKLETMFTIVKHIIEVKLSERKAREEAADLTRKTLRLLRRVLRNLRRN